MGNFFYEKYVKYFQKRKKYDIIGVNALKEKDFAFDYDNFILERPFDFRLHSSIGCGGVAKLAFYPRSEEEALSLLSKIEAREEEWVALGNLTNLLASDLGTQKTVIRLKKMTDVKLLENQRIYAEAGVTSGELLNTLKKAGLGGAEFLTGIPCTLGGALYMNAGAGGNYISELVESVRVYRNGKTEILSLKECDYAYKTSVFMREKSLILGATLQLSKSDEYTIAAQEKAWKARRAHLPKGKSMGCVFKNPTDISAGALIEKAGLKGLRVGGAKVSATHANFIINDGNAKSKEVRSLIALVKNAVYAYCGVVLEEEIQYLD